MYICNDTSREINFFSPRQARLTPDKFGDRIEFVFEGWVRNCGYSSIPYPSQFYIKTSLVELVETLQENTVY